MSAVDVYHYEEKPFFIFNAKTAIVYEQKIATLDDAREAAKRIYDQNAYWSPEMELSIGSVSEMRVYRR